MRIISGENKGMKLYAPEGQSVRPTGDKIKESIFNMLGPLKNEAYVLELFAGSGSIGIEFLARGAFHCTFVDASKKSLSYVKRNLGLCKFTDRADILQTDYLKAIIQLSGSEKKFDYIFADPPYSLNISSDILKNIIECNILKTEGVLIIESEKNEKVIDNIYTNMIECKEKIYGRTKISIIRLLEDK